MSSGQRRGVALLVIILGLVVRACAGQEMLQKPARPAATLQVPALTEVDRDLARSVFQQLIEINTSHSVGSTTVAAEAMRKRLLDAGFPEDDVVVVGAAKDRMNLVVRYRTLEAASGEIAPEKPVLMVGHLDVVEAPRAEWTVDPFTLTETDGYFYGRGTQDMKNSDAAMVTSFLSLKKAGWSPKREIILALTADEEGGGHNGVEWLLKNRHDLVDAAFAINPDAGGLLLDNGKPVELDLEGYREGVCRLRSDGDESWRTQFEADAGQCAVYDCGGAGSH